MTDKRMQGFRCLSSHIFCHCNMKQHPKLVCFWTSINNLLNTNSIFFSNSLINVFFEEWWVSTHLHPGNWCLQTFYWRNYWICLAVDSRRKSQSPKRNLVRFKATWTWFEAILLFQIDWQSKVAELGFSWWAACCVCAWEPTTFFPLDLDEHL